MEDFLKTEFGMVCYYSRALSDCASELKDTLAVGVGNTNHGVNSICNNNYEEVIAQMTSYDFAAQRDAERIKSVAFAFEELDEKMKREMLFPVDGRGINE